MDLLEKASVILTPTAYNNGEALCVKPSDGSGDFDFSRNSAATRVNAQGLVENVQILSSNLVQNGDFSEEGVEEVSNGSFSQEGAELITNGNFDTDSDWGLGTNWNISNGKANAVSSPNGVRLEQFNLGQSINRPYKVTFSVSNLTQGSFKVWFGSVQSQTITSDGDYIIYLTPTTTDQIFIYTIGTTTGSIDNVSVREVGQDWDLNGDVTIGDNLAHFESNTNTYSYIRQDISSLTTKTYKIQLEVKNYVSGAVQVAFSGASPIAQNLNVSSDGVYTAYLTPNANGDDFEVSREFNGGNFNFDITNISVKQVGMDWIVGSDWSIAENKAVSSGSGNNLQQTINISSNKTYKLTFDVISTSGTLAFDLGGATAKTLTDSGSKEYYFQSVNTNNLRFYGGNYYGSVTNISVIEITDDTNLPRINYEGFSYQDALGSELVVNGTFETDSNWSKDANWSIANGVATSTGYGRMFQSIPFLEANVGTKVKVSFDITENTNGGVVVNCYGSVSQLFTSVGTHTFTATTINNTNLYFNNVGAGGSFTGSIDNVSVKEYLGQEVVPNSGCGSWLFESQSTNLIEYSNDYSQSVWRKRTSDSTQVPIITSNYAVSPDGTQNASRVVITKPSTENDYAVIDNFMSVSKSVGDKFTSSIYIKANSIEQVGKEVNFYAYDGSYLTLITYALTNSWARIDAVHTATTATGNMETLVLGKARASVGGASLANMATDFLISFAQLEQQSYATSYIPTNGEPNGVTRNQDVCTNGGSLATINSTEGTLYFEGSALANDGTSRRVSLSDGSISNRVSLEFDEVSNKIKAFISRGGISQILQYDAADLLQYNKIAIKYKQNDFAIWFNGVEVVTDTSGNTPIGLNGLSFNGGGGVSDANKFFGKTKALAVFPYLTDQELTELTTI